MYRVRIQEYETAAGATDPFSGGFGALLGSMGSIALGILDLPIQVASSVMDRQTESGSVSSGSSASAAGPASTAHDDRSSHSRALSVDDQRGKKKERRSKAKVRSTIHTGFYMHLFTLTTQSFAYGFYKELTGQETIARNKTGITEASHAQASSDQPWDSIASDAAKGAGKGMGRIVEVGLKTPLDFTMGLAKGFRNATRLYGDDTVRQQDRITGFHSGIKTASKVGTLCIHLHRVLR